MKSSRVVFFSLVVYHFFFFFILSFAVSLVTSFFEVESDSCTGQYLLNLTSGNYFAKSHILQRLNTGALT